MVPHVPAQRPDYVFSTFSAGPRIFPVGQPLEIVLGTTNQPPDDIVLAMDE